MRLLISWWDNKDGIGVATTETGIECLLHKSNFSANQCNSFKSQMVIHGDVRELSKGIFILEKVRVTNKFENETTRFRRKPSKDVVA